MKHNAGRAYKSFHGRDVRGVTKINFTVPKQLIRLGEAVAIEYECDKYNGGGDGKQAIYRHEFETPVMLFMDTTKKRQLYIIGNRLKVTNAGIENLSDIERFSYS